MRGTPPYFDLLSSSFRIIPAYAGNTGQFQRSCPPIEDHPRVCGEHWDTAPSKSREKGSSPRMRGTRLSAWLSPPRLGIIPAYAGNTYSFFRSLAAEQDHPRVCGEHSAIGSARAEGSGSSPRMRGTPPFHPPIRPEGGIIPAYAGNTFDIAEGEHKD